MKILKTSVIVITFFSLASCTSGGPDINTIAQEMCGCTSPMVELTEKVKELSESGDAAGAAEFYSKIQAAAKEGEACSQRLQEKYGDLIQGGEHEAAIQAAMRKACPSVSKMMDEALNNN